MTKREFTEIIKKRYTSVATIKAIRSGKMRPSYENMKYFAIESVPSIPFEAWEDIRTWLKEQTKEEQK